MIDNRRIAKNTLFLYFRMMLVLGVQLYTSRIIIEALGIEDFGIYNVVGGIVMMFAFLNGSLGAATSRFITFELGRRDFVKLGKIFNVAFVTHIAIALLVILLAETVGVWFFYAKMTIPEQRLEAAMWVYQISILTSFFSLTQVPYNATIIAHEDMKVYAYVGVVEVFCRLLIVFVIEYAPFDRLVFYAMLLFILQVAVLLYYRFYCRRYDETRLCLCREKSLYVGMFKYAGSDLIGNISILAQGQGLNLLLNVYFGPVVNAARAIAYQVQGALTQFSGNFLTAVKPQIIKTYAEGDIPAMMKLVHRSSWLAFYLMLMVSLPICLESDFLLSLWLGDYPDHTPQFMVLVIILCLIQTLKSPRVSVLHATGHLFLANVVVGGVLCAAFPIAYLCLELGCEPDSVFWAANATLFVSEFVSVFILRKYIVYSIAHYLCDIHLRCFVVTLICAVPLYFIWAAMESGWLRLISVCASSIAIVGGVAFAVGIDGEARKMICAFAISKLKRK